MPKIPKNMNRLSIKKFIQKSRTGIIVIVIAAALAQVLNIGQYIYTRYAVKKHAIQQAYDDQKEIQRVLGIKTRVETAVENAMGDVLISLQEPEKFYGIVSRMVSRNPDIVASTIAMRPGYYPQKDSLYAPFAFNRSKKSDRQPTTKLLAYDYTQQDWFKESFNNDTARWSEVYTDTGGSGMSVFTYSKPIHNSQGKVIGVLTGDVFFKDLSPEKEVSYSAIDTVNVIGFLIQLIGLLLIVWIVWRYAKKFREVNRLVMEQELMSKELQIASDIQTAMLPTNSDEENTQHHVQIEKLLLSAPDVGADFYDYFYSGHNIILCIGDVPGSNVMASLMMSITRSVFRTAATILCEKTEKPSPAEIVSEMNHSMCAINHNQMFSTLFVGVLNLDNACFTYCNAGNPSPVVLDASNGAKLLDTIPNIPIGVMDDYEYEEQQITLTDKFTLFLYNDGVYETENIHHEAFGQKRMLTRLNSSARMSEEPKKVLAKMQEVLESHRGTAPQNDDVMMLALRID